MRQPVNRSPRVWVCWVVPSLAQSANAANSQYRLTLRFERTGCGRRQFIVRVHVLIKGNRHRRHLIAEDLMVSTDPCS